MTGIKINLTRLQRAINFIQYYALNIAIIVSVISLMTFLTVMNVYFLRCP